MKDYSLFLGRLQPGPHLGHKQIIEGMPNPIVVIVRGAVTSKNSNNPFSEEYQIHLLRKVFPEIEYSISPNGFLPGILGYLRKQGKNITTVYCGADRIEGYKKAVEEANKQMDDKYIITFIETPRVTSSSKVRKALLEDDRKTFEDCMPAELYEEYDILKQTINNKVKSFDEWLSEEAAVTTTANIEIKDKPLGKKIVRRKKIVKKKEVNNATPESTHSRI